MLRPERMSKVSVTGSKAVMDDVVEVVHDLHLLHVTDYDGSWEGFSPGDPAEGADEVSEKLVTVRSLESILDVDEDDAERSRLVTDEAVESELEEIRTEVNELDDRRTEIEEELRAVEDAIDAMAPFAALGIDLDLLVGYDSLQVAVGEGDRDAVGRALTDAGAIREYELFAADGVVAAFARPVEGADEDALSEALVGAAFSELELPAVGAEADGAGPAGADADGAGPKRVDADGAGPKRVDADGAGPAGVDADGAGPAGIDADGTSPEEYLAELRERRDQLASRLETVESQLEDVKLDAAGFLLAVEESLSIEVQKREAPLSFATTEHAFVAEGWIPTDRYAEFADTVTGAVDGRVEVEELERADYDEHGHPEHGEHTEAGAAATDGGTTVADEPPVVQDNPGPTEPFELLVEMVDLPRYDEFDPTVLVWLTFPAFFGFMIGDVGYGILYVAIGYWLWTSFDSDAVRSLGGVALWAGGFTILFGVLYGEFLGLHQLGEVVWGGNPPMHKGLQPAEIEYARGWIVLTAVVGVAHVTVGYTLSFAKDLRHGVADAVFESGSWVLMMWGLWGWIFSKHQAASKPAFLVGPESVFNGHPLPLGFTGLPEVAGIVAAAAFVVGLVMIFYVEPVEGVEAIFLQVLVRGLSYTRIAAVLLAKAGMAFVVNLLVFGAYAEETGHGAAFHFLFFSDHTLAEIQADAHYELIFAGMVNGTGAVELAVGWLAGILIFVVGHLIVLGLGVTSAGLQAVRPEYVEFFTEFYDGGGEPYEPFGYERRFTTED